MARRLPRHHIRDPLWGEVYLYDEEIRVIDSDLFQRQRGIKQLGTSMFVYPSAVQTRFVHALGNLHLIDQMVRAAIRNASDEDRQAFTEACGDWLGMPTGTNEEQDELFDQVRIILRIAGLCHDLGHLPMGHVVEVAISEDAPLLNSVLGAESRSYAAYKPRGGVALHEYFTYKLLEQNLAPRSDLFGTDVRLGRGVIDVIAATQPHQFDRAVPQVVTALAELVSSNIDSDRAEYLRRDGYVSGSGYGQYDLQRLIDTFTVVRRDRAFVVRPSARALTAIRTFLLERVNAYQHLYYHHLGVLFDALLSMVMRLTLTPSSIDEIVRDVRQPGRQRIRATLESLPASTFHYTGFVGTHALDDARLWTYLWDVYAALETVAPGERTTQLRRAWTYLDVLLRRRRHWVPLWKTPGEASAIGTSVLDAFRRALDDRRGSAASREAYLVHMKAKLDAELTFDFPPDDMLVLNFFALGYPTQLPKIAQQLEAELGPGHYVAVGHRAYFKPIKDPKGYEIVVEQGATRELERLVEISPATVKAVQGLWFENPLLRVFVLTEDVLDEGRRAAVQRRAGELLPAAVRAWVAATPSVSFDPGRGFGGYDA